MCRGSLYVPRPKDPQSYYLTCHLITAHNLSLCSPIRSALAEPTPIKSNVDSHPIGRNNVECAWDEWIEVPIKYSEVPFDCQISVSVYAVSHPSLTVCARMPQKVGHAVLSMFDCDGMVKRSVQRVLVHMNDMEPSVSAVDGEVDSIELEIERYENMLSMYEQNLVKRSEWLDKLVIPEIEQKKKHSLYRSKNVYLYITLPDFNVPVIYHEHKYSDSYESELYDPEAEQLENPIELKHRRLMRSHRVDPMDRELKPNPKTRDQLQLICKYPPTFSLTREESDLMWRFRYYQTREKKALTKFLKCVDWSDGNETQQALDLLPIWSDIDADDALELLGPSFSNPMVRNYAIKCLEKANDDDLQLYLLQLVEAIKFENIGEKGAYESPLVEFLVKRAVKNRILGNDLHWYLMCECDDQVHGKTFAKVSYHFMSRMVEHKDGYLRRDVLRKQADLLEKLCSLTRELRSSKESRLRKIEKLQVHLADPNKGFASFPPIPLPLDASIEICGIKPDKATMFKSNLMPLKLVFIATGQTKEYPIIFKLGDDLRQDQLVMQVIKLMDKLLRQENLDLKLMPYKVLATGSDHGMLQFIDSVAIANIISRYNGEIQSYLRDHNADPSSADTFGIKPSVLDTYVRSCAGYCVITYLLGIGDRHLDNLLLTTKGNLFHIDFGYMLGRDPKPYPPPMKLNREMVDAMGGVSSVHFQKFKSLCYSAFMILRKSSNLILNLFSLMVDANIPDIKLEPDKAVLKVQEKFRLDLTDEEAIQYFQMLINDSVTAMFPQLMETVHKLAQLMKS